MEEGTPGDQVHMDNIHIVQYTLVEFHTDSNSTVCIYSCVDVNVGLLFRDVNETCETRKNFSVSRIEFLAVENLKLQ